jgi:hypothetical protein
MTFQLIAQWLGVCALLVSIANTVWVWLSVGRAGIEKKLTEIGVKIDGLAGNIDVHDSRIQAVEAEQRHTPSKDDIKRLELDLTRITGDIGKLGSEVGGVARTVQRIDDYLRSKGQA